MRSSAIAEELIARGEKVFFVGSISNLPWVEERINQLGFTEIYSDPTQFISNCASDILLIDSYEIASNNPFILPTNWFKIVAIVDEVTPDYFCDLRIHPGLNSSWYRNSKVPFLSGPQYVPFRSILTNTESISKKIDDAPKIAVVAGGSDPHNLVREIAEILSSFNDNFNVLLFSNTLSKSNFDSRFQVIEIGNQLDSLTQDVDLIFTTSSTSSLEFLARGLCVGIACAVENQRQHYNSLGQLGAAERIGFKNKFNVWELDINSIHSLVTTGTKREILKANAVGLFDFKGAARIVDAIRALEA